MARQTGPIQIVGTFGGINYYKTKNGYYARLKAVNPKYGSKAYKGYRLFRDLAAEFGRAAHAGKRLRFAFRDMIPISYAGNGGMMFDSMLRVIRSGPRGCDGGRHIRDGNLGLLEGFDFNVHSPMAKTLRAPYLSSIDYARGRLTIAFPSFVPEEMILAPDWTTHFKIICGGAAIDFKNASYELDMRESEFISWGKMHTGDLKYELALTPNKNVAMFLAMRLCFYHRWPGETYEIEGGYYDAMAVIRTEQGSVG